MPRSVVTTESSELRGRVALVSGGSRGVGRAVSLSLASAGAAVAVNFRRDKDAATEVVGAIRQLGGTAIDVQAAVDDLDQDEVMVGQITDQLGEISIFVSNAGIASRGLSVVDGSPEGHPPATRSHGSIQHGK